MIGKIISHYRIIEQLGAGGMGVVYKAEDTKLKRTVALKFLPPELTRDPEAKQRFIREAQAASSFDHPNICTIYEINETGDDQLFIVMACYEGETLKDKIKDKRLKTKDAIAIAIQVANGLARAHEEGIIHRDVKPANIIITDRGEVKILDFGLAKLVGQVQLTKDTSTLGTVAYMSPEQVGGKEVDQRTDIWSLGVVIYEMLTGQLPFKGDYEQAIIYAILNEDPQLLGTGEKIFSAEIEKILSRALNKNPQERYANVTEILQELSSVRENIINNKSEYKSTKTKNVKSRTIIISSVIIFILIAFIASFLFFPTSESKESIKSMAVLPFTNIKNDPKTNYLGDALAAEIIKDLSYLQNLNVLPFSAVRNLDDWSDLSVEYILTGNYLKETNTIRLNFELFRSSNQEMIWNEHIEEEFENAFKLQDMVSDKVIKELSIKFAPEEQMRMHKDVLKDPLAYEYYLKALSYDYTVEGSSMAIKMLNQSIQIDSTYAPAFYELGYHTIRISQYLLGFSEGFKNAEKNLLKAISLNKDYIEARTYLAGIYTETGNTEKALIMTKEALNINPNNAWTHFRLSYIYRYTGMNKESIQAVEKALELLPNNPRFRSVRQTFIYAGDYQRALEVADLDPTNPISIMDKGLLFLRMGDSETAIKYFIQSIETEPDSNTYAFNESKSYLECLGGNKERAKQYAHRLVDAKPYDGELLYELASLFGFIGDQINCIHYLNNAVKGGFYNYPFLLRDPFLDSVRDKPEFQEVLALAKKKHEAFKQKFFVEEQ